VKKINNGTFDRAEKEAAALLRKGHRVRGLKGRHSHVGLTDAQH